MTGSTPEHLPEHWMRCAQEVRDQAREMKDPLVKRQMEAIAQGYERLARHAEKRRISRSSKT
jgi:hypothetical protein